MNRRSFLGAMLAGAVAAVARISPLVDEQRLTFRGIPIKLENRMWYRDPSGPMTIEQARAAVDRIADAQGRRVIYAWPPMAEHLRRVAREVNGA